METTKIGKLTPIHRVTQGEYMTNWELQKLRDQLDNKHIDEFSDEAEEEFNDWDVRSSAEYKSSYLATLAEIYNIYDTLDEYEAVKYAEAEVLDWLKIYEGSDYVVAKIHACYDFINGEDLFGENYGK